MTEPHLIAHKVHGEPAFDIAHQIPCPMCNDPETGNPGCHECDELGYWWIVSTSGHRAYPWWHMDLYEFSFNEGIPDASCEMPDPWPDHYLHRAEPQRSLIDLLGLIHKPLTITPTPIKRRL